MRHELLMHGLDGWLGLLGRGELVFLGHQPPVCHPAQGAASQWAAQRVRDASFASAFDAVRAANANQPVMFTG